MKFLTVLTNNFQDSSNGSKIINEITMIEYLQERFGISKIQASVIYFQLQDHFKNEKKMTKNSTEFLEST